MSASAIQSRVPASVYFTLPALSMSQLKEMRRSPQHYLHGLTHSKDTKPLRLGVAAHTAALEPERFEREFAVWGRRTDGGASAPRRGQYWDAFVREHGHKTIITQEEHDLARAIQAAVRANPIAAQYLAAGEPEVTFQWMMRNRECRGRVDWFTRIDVPVIFGLKTARDCRHMKFGSAAATLGYHLHWAWYHDGYEIITRNKPKMVECVVESAPPHAVAVYTIPQDIIDQGRDDYERLLDQLEQCELRGFFPGPQEVEEPLSLPSWAFPGADDLSETGLEW